MSVYVTLYSPVALERADILTLVREVATQRGYTVEEHTAEEETGHSGSNDTPPLSGFGSPAIRVFNKDHYIYIHFYKREDWDPDQRIEKMSRRLGAEQQIMLDMRVHYEEPAMEIAYAFADRWPCTLEYGKSLLDNAGLQENRRYMRELVQTEQHEQVGEDTLRTDRNTVER